MTAPTTAPRGPRPQGAPLRLFTFAAPSRFYTLTGWLIPVFWAAAIGFSVAALYIGFFIAPTDRTQGDAYRIIFITCPRPGCRWCCTW